MSSRILFLELPRRSEGLVKHAVTAWCTLDCLESLPWWTASQIDSSAKRRTRFLKPDISQGQGQVQGRITCPSYTTLRASLTLPPKSVISGTLKYWHIRVGVGVVFSKMVTIHSSSGTFDPWNRLFQGPVKFICGETSPKLMVCMRLSPLPMAVSWGIGSSLTAWGYRGAILRMKSLRETRPMLILAQLAPDKFMSKRGLLWVLMFGHRHTKEDWSNVDVSGNFSFQVTIALPHVTHSYSALGSGRAW